MIWFKAKHLRDTGFAIVLPGNDGEEQLTILTAFGQDGTTHLMIVASTCDGGAHRIMYNTGSVTTRKGRKTTKAKTLTAEDALEAIHDAVIDWSSKTTDAITVDQQQEHERQVGKLIKAIAMKFGLTKSELAEMTEMFTEKQFKKLMKHAKKQQV